MRTRTTVLVDLCVLLLSLLGDQAFSDSLEVGVTLNSTDQRSFTNFTIVITQSFNSCLCGSSPPTCNRTAKQSDFYQSNQLSPNQEIVYENITQNIARNSKANKGVSYFVCSVILPNTENGRYAMSCSSQQSDSVPCPTDSCSVSININCSRYKHVTIIWSSTQQARVYKSSDVTLVGCCPITPTTPDQSSTTTLTATTHNSTSSGIIPITTNLTTTSINPNTKVSSTESTIIPPFSSSSTTATESSNPTEAVQDQQSEAVTSQFSDLIIGIIIGAVVAAILITILVMCVIWRILTRSKSNPGNINQPNRSKHDSANEASTTKDEASKETKDSHRHKKSFNLAPPPAVPNKNEVEYSHISQDYNYIDIGQPPSLSNIDADRGLTLEPQQTSSYSSSLEPERDENHSVYSHLRENKVTFDNPYNCATNEQIGFIKKYVNVPHSAQGFDQELDNRSIAPPIHNNTTNQKTSPDSENEKAESKENHPISSYNNTKIKPQPKVRKHVLDNYKSVAGQEPANGPPFSGNQIVQETPNFAIFEMGLSEPNIPGTYENSIPNTKSTPVFSNAVYGSQEKLELNTALPQEETTYANLV